MANDNENTLSAYLGTDFQLKLLWQILVEPEFSEKIIENIAVEYFDDPNLKRMFLIVWEYYKEFGKVPNFQNKSIHSAINLYKTTNNVIEEETLFGVLKRIENWNNHVINKQLYYDGEVVQKQTHNFIKQQEYRKLAEYISMKTKSGEIRTNKNVVNLIEEKFRSIADIGSEADNCEEVIDNIDSALRKEFRQTIPTGVEVIDELTGGGLGKGEIGLILTPSGVGKTTLLTKIANTAYDDGKNVAQIIFEDTIDQIKRKHYTIWSGVPQSDIDNKLELVRERVVNKTKEVVNQGGRLIIKKFNQDDVTITDIKKWMSGYEKKFGFKFDLLVLDYLDCLEPHKKTNDRNEAELVIVKGFESLASEYNIPCWSAIQTNRSGFDAQFVEAYQSGGSIKRIQKSHFFMSVAKTPEQKEASLANIRIIKARFAKDGQSFTDCIFNNDSMEIRIEDDRYKKWKYSKEKKKYGDDDINRIESDLLKLKSNDDTVTNSTTQRDLIFNDLRERELNKQSNINQTNINEVANNIEEVTQHNRNNNDLLSEVYRLTNLSADNKE